MLSVPICSRSLPGLFSLSHRLAPLPSRTHTSHWHTRPHKHAWHSSPAQQLAGISSAASHDYARIADAEHRVETRKVISANAVERLKSVDSPDSTSTTEESQSESRTSRANRIFNTVIVQNIPNHATRQHFRRLLWKLKLPLPHSLQYRTKNALFSGKASMTFLSQENAAVAKRGLAGVQFRGGHLQTNYLEVAPAKDMITVETLEQDSQTKSTTDEREPVLEKHECTIEGLSRLVRTRGKRGAWQVIDLLQKHGLLLPTDGVDAQELWLALTREALYSYDDRLLIKLFAHALKIHEMERRVWPHWYETVIGHFLGTSPTKARQWATRIRQLELPTPRSLQQLVQIAAKSRTKMRNLKCLDSLIESRDVSDVLIPALLKEGDFVAAARWDRYLKIRGMAPSSASGDLAEMPPSPAFDELAKTANQLSSVVHDPNKSTAPNVYVVDGVQLVDRPKKMQGGLSDSFAARCFATTAFSLDAIARGLRSVGLSMIGPLSMREIAVRSSSCADLLNRVKTLQCDGVSIQNCAYSRFLTKLASTRQEQILDSVLQSDLHPDTFEDVKLHRRLLLSYIKAKDWVQAERSMALLSTVFDQEEAHLWNLILCALFNEGSWSSAKDVYESMLQRGIVVRHTTVRTSFFALEARTYTKLSQRAEQKAQATAKVDTLKLVTNMWLKILRSGGYVPPSCWNQLHKFYGQDYRLAELESLSIWLAVHYSKASPLTADGRKQASSWRDNPQAGRSERQVALDTIFSPLRQQAMVEWGFKSLATAQSKRQPLGFTPSDAVRQLATPSAGGWDRGLLLLKELQRLGVAIDKDTLKHACTLRLRQLFSRRRRPSARLENRVARRMNREDFSSIVRRINELWQLWPEVDEGKMSGFVAFNHIMGRPRIQSWGTRFPSPDSSDGMSRGG